MKTLYLVDGSGYIFRAFYAVAPLSNSAGLPTNAVLGFTKMMLKLLRDVSAEYIAITFDRPEPTFRHEMYSEYKANRAECPAELIPQMPYFRSIAQALNIPVLEQAGVEADDILATLAKRLRGECDKIIVVSGDKDLCQLVDDHVQVWEPMRDIQYDRKGVLEKFGVNPDQIVDYLTLIGDTSDNVPGIKGIGPKTAEALLAYFTSLDEMISRVDEIHTVPGLRGAASVEEKIKNSLDAIALSKKLVTLDAEIAPWARSALLEDFKYKGPDPERAIPLFQELEFDKLLSQLPGGVAVPLKGKSFEIVTKEFLPSFIETLASLPAFAIDTETDSLDPLTCGLVGISISWEEGRGYFLPFGVQSDTEVNLPKGETLDLLRPILEDPEIKKCGLNLKYDLGVLRTHGVEMKGIAFDSMLASYVINPDRRQHGLSALTKVHLKETMVEYTDLVGKLGGIQFVQPEPLKDYACHDAEASWRLWSVLQTLLDDAGTEPVTDVTLRGVDRVERAPAFVFKQIELPLLTVLEEMERNGIRIDVELLTSMSEEFQGELIILEQRIQELAGEEFNLNSPKQLSSILFEKLMIPSKGLKKTTSGISTDASVLEKLAPTHEIVRKILEYRELFKLRSTYLESLKSLVSEKTGRIHTSYNQAVAATGRLSSSDPNLQNIPIRNPRGRKIRQAFRADDGFLLLSADYSQIELRILAHISGDKNLRETYYRNEDIHLSTAKELLGGTISTESELKELRRIAKTINFGIVYGMSAFRLANELGISRTAANDYIEGYFRRYPGVRVYFDEQERLAEERGYVETIFGRRRYLQEIDTTGRDQGYAVRSVLNAPIQGSAADIIKLAMNRLYNRLKPLGNEARMALQVHDELVFEIRADRIEEIKELIVQEMEQAVTLTVPLKVDVKVGERWG